MTDCYYCGAIATTKDHVYPMRLRYRQQRWRVYIVPACRECNILLGGRYYGNASARRFAIKSKLRRRYADVLAMPYWSTAELQNLGPEMSQTVVEAMQLRERILRRLEWNGDADGIVPLRRRSFRTNAVSGRMMLDPALRFIYIPPWETPDGKVRVTRLEAQARNRAKRMKIANEIKKLGQGLGRNVPN